jgi:hypothetical protein
MMDIYFSNSIHCNAQFLQADISEIAQFPPFSPAPWETSMYAFHKHAWSAQFKIDNIWSFQLFIVQA